MKPEATINPDDPRLSAYLLGEMPADELLIFENQLQRSPEARAELDMMRSAVEMLRQSFEAEWQEGMSEETTPTLSVLPSPEVGKVVDFQNEQKGTSAAARRFPSKVAAIASLAAAIALAAFMLPKSTPGSALSPAVAQGESRATPETNRLASSSPVAASVSVSVTEEIASAEENDFYPESFTATPVSVPNLGYQDAANTGRSLQTVSTDSTLTGDAGALKARPLGADPTITAVRFLSDDPIDLRQVPLPARVLSYLPEDSAGIQPIRAMGTTSHHAINAQLLGAADVYLDRKRYPDPEIVHRQVELTGGVFREAGDQTRSLYQTEQRSDASGRTSIIVKGMVRLEAEGALEAAIDEPDPSYEFGIMPVSRSGVQRHQEILSLPSGVVLRKIETEIGSPPEPSGDIATRYILRQQDRLSRAANNAENGRRQLEKGEYGSAASNFELSLEILPDAPATEKLRSQIMSRLDKANAALAE